MSSQQKKVELIEVPTMPTDGTQFIVSWEVNNLPWSEVVKFVGGVAHIYEGYINEFAPAQTYQPMPGSRFYILKP